MGIIAPEKKKKSNVFSKVSKNSSTGFILFITVVVLMFLGFIKTFTSSNTSNKNALNKTGVIKFSGNEKISFDDEYLVQDKAKLLTASEKNSLNELLNKIETETSVQIRVVTLNSTGNYSVEELAIKIAEENGIGQKGKDNGALLLVSMENHDIRIETGYGTEGQLTDVICSRIIRNVIAPAFQKDNYYKGLYDAVQIMADVISGDESLVEEEKNISSKNLPVPVLVFVIFFMILWVSIFTRGIVSSIFNPYRRRSFLNTMGPFVNTHGSSHSSHTNSFGSSFHSFHGGGGHFGGGGASGHW